MRWSARRLHLLGLPAIALASVGWLLFWPPYRLTGGVSALLRRPRDQVATYKLLVGAGIYALWLALLAAGAAWLAFDSRGTISSGESIGSGVWLRPALASAGVVLGLPLIGMIGLWVRERWRSAASDLRRFWAQRSRREMMAELAQDQESLARRIEAHLS